MLGYDNFGDNHFLPTHNTAILGLHQTRHHPRVAVKYSRSMNLFLPSRSIQVPVTRPPIVPPTGMLEPIQEAVLSSTSRLCVLLLPSVLSCGRAVAGQAIAQPHSRLAKLTAIEPRICLEVCSIFTIIYHLILMVYLDWLIKTLIFNFISCVAD